MKIVKFLLSSVENDSRDKREIRLINELGYKVDILCGGDFTPNIYKIDDNPIYYKCQSFSGIKSRISRIFAILKYWYKLTLTLRHMDADVISCHDLVPLAIGNLSNFFKRHKAKLVYDSHEFELGRNKKRTKATLIWIKMLEKYLIKKSAFTIVVNDSIADELVKVYNLRERPVVARNVTNNWKLDKNEILLKRQEMCKDLNCNIDSFLIMYHGGVTTYRGIESTIQVLSKLNNTYLVILGDCVESYKETLVNLCKNENVLDKVLFLPAVPYNEIYKYVGAVNVGIMNIVAKYKSYYFALPNKFFENVQSLTPVIVSNFPEMSSLVNKYQIGLVDNPDDLESIKETIIKMKNDKEKYKEYKNNLLVAKNELCWENEKNELKNAYLSILS